MASRLSTDAFAHKGTNRPKATRTEPKLAANKAGKPGALSNAKAQATGIASEPVQSTLGTIGSALKGSAGGIAGAVGLGGLSLFESNKAKKDAIDDDPNRPNRRRATAALESFVDERTRRANAVATLSAAVFDWAAALR